MVNIEKENKKEFNNILYCKKCATKGNSGGYAGSTCNWYRCSKCGSYIFPLDKANLYCENCGRILFANEDKCRFCGVKVKKIDYDEVVAKLLELKLLEPKPLEEEPLEEDILCKKCGNKLCFFDDVANCCGSYIVRKKPKIVIEKSKKKVIYVYEKFNLFKDYGDKLINLFSFNFLEETTGDKVRQYEYEMNFLSYNKDKSSSEFIDKELYRIICSVFLLVTPVILFVVTLLVLSCFYPSINDLLMPIKEIAFYLADLKASFYSNFFNIDKNDEQEILRHSNLLLHSIYAILFILVLFFKKNSKIICWIVGIFLGLLSFSMFIKLFTSLP